MILHANYGRALSHSGGQGAVWLDSLTQSQRCLFGITVGLFLLAAIFGYDIYLIFKKKQK